MNTGSIPLLVPAMILTVPVGATVDQLIFLLPYFRFWYIRLRIEHFLEEKRYNQKISKDVPKSLELSDKSMKLPVTIVDVKDDKKGIVTIISDDGFFDSGVILNELANQYDICATVAGAVSIVKPHLKEWQQIIAEGHIEMVNHSRYTR